MNTQIVFYLSHLTRTSTQLLMELCRYGTPSTARIASRTSAKILEETSLHVWHVYGHNVPWVS